MKQETFTLRNRSLLSKLLLTFALIIGANSAAWADGKVLPYSYDLESTDLATEGWTNYNLYDGGSSYNVSQRYNNSSYAHSSSYSFRFYGASKTTQYLISPKLETSTTGIVVSFYCYAPATSLAQTRTFSVGYSTTDATYTSFETHYTDYTINFEKSSTPEWKLITTTIDDPDAKYVAIKYTSSTTAYFDDFVFDANTSYKTPTSFAVSSYDATSATFSWTAGNNETTWQFDYSTSADFTPGSGINGTSVSITDNPYTLSGLTTGTTYYASIRADYGSDNYSEWTEKVAFTPREELDVLVNDGTTTKNLLPIRSGGIKDNASIGQFIIPSSALEDMYNRQITKLIFYAGNTNVSWGAATFEVYLKETTNTTFASSSGPYESWGTKVYNSAALSVDAFGHMEIELNTPFNYTTGNLLVGIKQTAKGTAGEANWYTASVSNAGLYSTSYGRTSDIPKMTIISVPITSDPVQIDGNGYTTYASPRILDLTALPSGLKAYKATVDLVNEKVRFTEINQTVAANTGMLLEGTPNVTYNIPVAGSGTAPEGNEFLVNSVGGTFEAGDYTYFALKKNSDPVLFATFDPSTLAIPSNKAYLKVASEYFASARSLSCVFDESETTAISEITTEKSSADGQIFNLAGQRVTKPTKGLYIVNGKKVIVK